MKRRSSPEVPLRGLLLSDKCTVETLEMHAVPKRETSVNDPQINQPLWQWDAGVSDWYLRSVTKGYNLDSSAPTHLDARAAGSPRLSAWLESRESALRTCTTARQYRLGKLTQRGQDGRSALSEFERYPRFRENPLRKLRNDSSHRAMNALWRCPTPLLGPDPDGHRKPVLGPEVTPGSDPFSDQVVITSEAFKMKS
ncbi:hypothetical protein CROQUDRAFT_95153 [Cronartium quercuum f. sp. fusiforme G11]|uniref:Uncharacterized protein n=1 Tax=Cronartium quercuum f. sp. fusiforme G11 TaxID=708437 RepID=A0A9P6NCT4_9BASI|nr:hypothetical protein CROQUDRAFT_95153 [Cronartium quercuum f. sp. fusiforme G11]